MISVLERIQLVVLFLALCGSARAELHGSDPATKEAGGGRGAAPAGPSASHGFIGSSDGRLFLVGEDGQMYVNEIAKRKGWNALDVQLPKDVRAVSMAFRL